mgnify:CR=1 FL=1
MSEASTINTGETESFKFIFKFLSSISEAISIKYFELKLIFKFSDVELYNAIKYAFECIRLPMEEVGPEVYQKLWRQHFWEILNPQQ